jgi:hypothetical protein
MHHDIRTEKVIAEIVEKLKIWDKNTARMGNLIRLLGVISIGGSLFVTTFLGFDEGGIYIPNLCLKIVSVVSAASLTSISAFNLVTTKNNIRRAWRILNSAYLKYQIGKIRIEELIITYKECEILIGNMAFDFNQSTQSSS